MQQCEWFSKTWWWVKEVRPKTKQNKIKPKAHTVWLHVYETLGKINVINSDGKCISHCLGLRMQMGIDLEGAQGNLLRWWKYSIFRLG